MKRTKAMFYNLLLLTAVSLFMRFVSVAFNVYITKRIGAGGIGLYSLVMSVGGFAVTFATSGVNLASTKLTAEAMGQGKEGDVRRIMKGCIAYSICFGIASTILLNALARPISLSLLCDGRCITPLRTLSLGLPFISLSSALSGYYNAVRRVYKSAGMQLGQQFLTIAITIKLLSALMPKGIGYACTALIGGSVIGEAASFIGSYILYHIDLKHHIKKENRTDSRITGQLLSVSLPIAFSAYVRSALVSVEHILIPIGLRKYGAGGDGALASYGTLHGMVMPIVLFPMAIISSFAGLLVPEIAGSISAGEDERVDRIISRVFHVTLAFSIGVGGIMICFSSELGECIYSSRKAGEYIRLMAPLIPVMYLDHIVDGMLKGMGEQLYSMRVNIFDASLSVVLVYFVVPIMGVYGYILIIIAMEIINLAFGLVRLFKRCSLQLKAFKWLIKPLLSVLGATSLTRLIASLMPICNFGQGIALSFNIALCFALYCLLLVATSSVTCNDIRWFKLSVR